MTEDDPRQGRDLPAPFTGSEIAAQEPPPLPAIEAAAPRPVEGRERDFLLLTIYVCMQHGQLAKASALAEALVRSGDDSREALLAQAVITFARGDYETTLSVLSSLDRIDPIERYGKKNLTDRQRMRSYLRARSLHELGDGRNAIDLYLRHTGRRPGEG